jgi:hypothetical protein
MKSPERVDVFISNCNITPVSILNLSIDTFLVISDKIGDIIKTQLDQDIEEKLNRASLPRFLNRIRRFARKPLISDPQSGISLFLSAYIVGYDK